MNASPERLETAPDAALELVEWRIDGKPSNSRARFVPYLDARDCARLLDEWVGPGNWRDEYSSDQIGGNPVMWCAISVRVGNEWVTKRDVGVPSNFEAAKGAVSDAFKRAAMVKWGVGRNVYKLPGDIWAPVRVTGEGDRQKAWPNDASLPAIHAELKKRGLGEVNGGTVAAAPEPEPVAPHLPDWLIELRGTWTDTEILDAVNALRDAEEPRKEPIPTIERFGQAPEEWGRRTKERLEAGRASTDDDWSADSNAEGKGGDGAASEGETVPAEPTVAPSPQSDQDLIKSLKDLTVADAMRLINDLDDIHQLNRVQDAELRGKFRKSVMGAVASRIENLSSGSVDQSEPASNEQPTQEALT